MRNIKLTIKYDGTNYSGWQFQKNAKTIQEALEAALKKILGKKVNLIGSGRTDSGVHALAQVANFKTLSKLPLKNIHLALNSNLPRDIVIWRVEEVDPHFNAQKSAKGKLYRYTIANMNFVDPFIRRYVYKCFYKLNLKKMRQAAAYIKGKRDFKAFQTKDGEHDGKTVRTIKRVTIEKDKDLVYIHMEADGFLYNMARNIVGTLIEAGRGKIAADSVKDILAKKDRRAAGPKVPALGLCLVEVRY